jgi:hypothetical protein
MAVVTRSSIADPSLNVSGEVASYNQQQFRIGETIYSQLFPQLQLRLDDIAPRK